MSRIVVTRSIPRAAIELLEAAGEVRVSPEPRALEPAELHSLVAGADAVVALLHDRIDDAFLDAAGNGLRAVANVAVGYDNIDVAACAARNVTVTNTPSVLTDATADLAMSLILMATRRLGEGERLIRARTPWKFSLDFMLGAGIQERTLGIVGFGAIGRATARRARAFGMRVVYSERHRSAPEIEQELGATFVSFPELLATADVVSLHCPLTPETRHLIGEPELRAMKPSAFLVNTSRGPVVDEAALAHALAAGEIAGAGLDVFEREPEVLPALLELENVVLLPHLGSATVETRTAMAVLAARNVVAILSGAEPLTPVTAS